MSATEVCKHVEQLGVVPVVRARSAELAERAIQALRAGGITVFEVTLTVPGAVELIRDLSRDGAQDIVIGAGTVLTAEDAERCMEAGARFIVSPGFDANLVAACKARGIAVMPGALTPTEVIKAWKAGANMVKIFPCSALGGAKYLKALKGPLPQVKLLPTGGVSATTAADYIAAGACALGVGGELVDQGALEAGQDSVLTMRARELLKAVQEARSPNNGQARPAAV
jgi:2-dehydro-3-deoxyphosphogluconate aldolase/(4S)-4-hydroxy-2-oxoglutarate aldolase